MSQFDMTGKVAIITGSSRGIGQAIAEEMADHGAKVVITSRNIGPCEDVAARINAKHPGAAIAVASSLSSKESLQAMVDTLAALHNTDHVKAGLGDYGKPGNYFERQVGRWTKQYRAAETERMDDIERLIDYLSRSIPEQTRTSIVHGDYRIDNMIFDATEPKVIAVLDWELSTTGDPLADFSYMMMNWVTEPEGRSGVKGLTGPDTGIPTIEQMTERYCTATGRDGVPDLNWYFAFGLFRLASIVQGIKKRVLTGTASSAHAAEMAERVPHLAAAAWDFAGKAQR